MATYLTIPKFGFVSQLNRIPITPTTYLGLCKLQNEILKKAKNAHK